MSDPTLEPPDGLTRDLAALFSPSAPPARVGDAVRRAARQELGPAARPTLRCAPWLVAGSAAAAALLLALGAQWFAGRTDESLLAADLDRSGRVDILDAWTLARAVERGGPLDAGLDLDGDGVVDGRDVDQLAQRAVRLDR